MPLYQVRECVDVLCSNVEMGDALLQREQAKKSLTFQNATSDAKVLGKVRHHSGFCRSVYLFALC